MKVTYEMRPCREIGGNEVKECPPEEAEFWTVYRRGEDGLASAVCDTLGREDAECLVVELNGLSDEANAMRPAIEAIARMKKDGEDGLDPTNDDAVDSLHSCIELARGALAKARAA